MSDTKTPLDLTDQQTALTPPPITTTTATTTPTQTIVESHQSAAIVEKASDALVNKVEDRFETVFGNKSKNELESIQSKDSHLNAGIFFSDPQLKIPKPILESLTLEMRFEKPSKIQASTLPLILDGKDVIAQAQSGAGKTIAFVIGMLSKIDTSLPQLQALCLTPTRELAIQILSDAVVPLSSRMPSLTYEDALPGRTIAVGEVCQSHIVVGTPGTVKKWSTARNKKIQPYLRLSTVRIFVLDEADTMVDQAQLGADTLEIKRQLNESHCQTLFFSATYGDKILSYAKSIVRRAFVVRPQSTEELVLEVIFQVKMDVSKTIGGKEKVLQDIYDFLTIQQSVVFVEQKTDAIRLTKLMQDAGFDVSTLHGDLLPEERDHVMKQFRDGLTKLLITTNVLARGVDVPAVAVVVNFDLPVRKIGHQRVVADEDCYLHRIGRCGRFGRKGTAINFLQNETDFRLLTDIEKFYHTTTTEWDPSDIQGLSDEIKMRPEGGEVEPAAIASSSENISVSVTLLS